MADKILKELTLKIWRQKDAKSKGEFKTYKVHNISTGTSFLEMLDILNEQLVEQNEEPVAFDHDCREGICGTCSLFVDGRAHGPDDDVTTCQLHMRRFEDGATITIEPWRWRAGQSRQLPRAQSRRPHCRRCTADLCPGRQSELRQNHAVQPADRLQPACGQLSRRYGGPQGRRDPQPQGSHRNGPAGHLFPVPLLQRGDCHAGFYPERAPVRHYQHCGCFQH